MGERIEGGIPMPDTEAPRLAIKFLTAEGRGPRSNFKWPRPGEWVEAEGELSACHNGVHAATLAQALAWCNASAWLIELDGEIIEADDKLCARRGRLVRRLDAWDERSARLLAADCAERVLPIFERECPDDARPRKAIEAARAYARGEIHPATWDVIRVAAWDVAWTDAPAAAWSAARAAAWAVAWDVAGVAARNVARLAVNAAGMDTASAAVEDAEREWQGQRLAACLGLTSDELDALGPLRPTSKGETSYRPRVSAGEGEEA